MHSGMNLYYFQLATQEWVSDGAIYIQAYDEEEAKRIGERIQAGLDVSRKYEYALENARQFVSDAEKATKEGPGPTETMTAR